MKKHLLLICGLVASLATNAQVTNRAIQFEPNGTVECGQIPTLDNLNSYTIQFWINPTQWIEGATILSRGEKFSAKLGAEGSVVFTVGNKSITATSSDLKTGEWNGVMLNCSGNNATAYVNNTKAGSGTLDAVPSTEDELYLGGGYAGKLDEVRLWSVALDNQFDYFTNNTLNKWAPQWENLLVYYKMDQADSCPALVDYRAILSGSTDSEYNNHGVFSKEGVRRVDADNAKMPYLWNAAYTANERFFDRVVPQDQYLLSNAVIILGSDADGATGAITLRTPNIHAISVTGAKYEAEFEGHDGVISYDGKEGSHMECPATLAPAVGTYSFLTWLYLDEWTEGGYLFRCETPDKQNGLAIYLGDEATHCMFVRVNGNVFATPNNVIPVGEWVNVAVVSNANATNKTNAFTFYFNGAKKTVNVARSTGSGYDVRPTGHENCLAYIGEGLKGKLDDTSVWIKSLTGENVSAYMTNFPVPTITKHYDRSVMDNMKAVYRYNDPDNLCFSTNSQDNWLKTIQSAYDGYAGAQFYMSVNGATSGGSAWTAILTNDAKRKKFAADLAEISVPYDGVELDLEWVYDANGWNNYSLLADEIMAALPEGKQFRISTHNVTYAYPKAKINLPTGFTFQQYGPQPTHFYYSSFTNYCNNFVNYGYPKDKIVTSYSTTTSQGQQVGGSGTQPIKGVKDGFFGDDYELTDANFEYKEINGYNYYFIGPWQVYLRAKYTREQNYQGIFYWDMGNDCWDTDEATGESVMPKYNSAKYCSYGLNSNVDPIVTDIEINHYGVCNDITDVIATAQPDTDNAVVSPSPATDNATVTIGGEAAAEVNVYSLIGGMVLNENSGNINVSGLQAGIYVVTAVSPSGKQARGKFIKR